MTNEVSENEKAPKAVEDIPLDQISDLSKNHEEVQIRLCRRNERGHVATVYSGLRMRVQDLPKIDDWVREMAGGGRYRCEVKDPQDITKYLMQPFWFSVEGPSRPPKFLGAPEPSNPVGLQPGQYAMPPQPQPVGQPPQPQQQGGQYAPPPSPWSNGTHPSQNGYAPPGQQYYAAAPRPLVSPLPPGATMASDEIASQRAAELKAELAAERAERKALMDKFTTENARLQSELQAAARRADEERHNAQLKALEAKLEALSQRPAERETKSTIAEYVPMLTALAPVLTAMVNSSKESASKGLELQAQGLNSLMQATLAQSNKTSDTERMLTTLGPLLMPLLGDVMKARSPESQASLFQAMAENNLNSVAMMAQLIEAFANANGKEGEPPWWLPMVREALGGVVNIAQAYTQSNGGLPGQQPLLPQPSGALAGYATIEQQQAQQQQAQQPTQQPEVVAASEAREATGHGNGNVAPGLEVMFSLLPSEYQTPEWRVILRGLHATPPMEVEKAAAMLASHIEHLSAFEMLPQSLISVRNAPRPTLEALLEKLPVARTNARYAVQVLDKTLAFLAEDGYSQGGEAEEDEEDEAIVTPAPGATGTSAPVNIAKAS